MKKRAILEYCAVLLANVTAITAGGKHPETGGFMLLLL